ncbi:pentatricopeptide repeat-containing protein At2g35030, mitochondrial [Phalaenopsis equestris]|uniref:pentatricopeptide repeat-containing protein At2g35030, mitochondrial n=1 Tax=Phalaenopsis equestris TaxID=78828 RepID=UPI0009E3EDD6|nr:pentatricopeptide repeat-containing protein At2g35030, mitochondrial [Phalaenopsis equestris]
MHAAINRLLSSAALRSFSSTAPAAAVIFQQNILITRLSRQGRISEARQLFDEIYHPDLITWTSLIAAYAGAGQLREAELLFYRSDALRDVITWTALLSGYARAGLLRDAEELFAQMPEKNVVSWNTMVSAYAENGMVDKALDMFDEMPLTNVVSWNTIITALAQCGRIEEACELFFQMTERDVVSWTAVLSGLSQNGRVDDARKVFDQMPHRNVVSWNAMISGYMQNMRIDQAMHLFEAMPERNITSWNTMITGFIQNRDLKYARKLFDEMPLKNVVSWTTMIAGYTQERDNESALKTFMEMLSVGTRPNEGTFVSVLTAISSTAAHIEGSQVHQFISKSNFQVSPFVQSALISMYSKCGDILTARKVFDVSNQKDLVNWNGMVAAYANHGYGEEAINLFKDMSSRCLKPNDITYIALLSACSHSGLVDEGLMLFDSLVKDDSIEMRDEHYACLVDLCSRAGRLDGIAWVDIENPSAFVWGALLGGCNLHRNVSLGKLAAREALKANPCNSGAYLLLSNIYASGGGWKEAAEIRSEMEDRGLKKQPGCSWIEIGNMVHVFLARDKFHSHFDSIERMLQELHHEMKMMKYVSSVCD